MASGRRRGPSGATVDFESKYLGMRDDHVELKRQNAELQQKVKELRTKFMYLEKGARRHGDSQLPARPKGSADPDTDRLIAELRKQNEELKRRNTHLQERVRKLKEEKARREDIETVKGRPVSTSGRSRRPVTASGRAATVTRGARPDASGRSTGTAAVAGSGRHQEVVQSLRARLDRAEQAMARVQQENASLRRELEEARGHEGGGARTSAVAVDGDYANLQRQLTEASAQLNLLRSRYEHLQRRSDSDREVLQRTQEELDDHARQARDLRHRVQRAEHERDAAQAHKGRARDLEDEVRSLRDENRALEEKVTQLCESPFINDAFERRERVEKLMTLEKQSRHQKVQIAHLQETAKAHHAEIVQLRGQAQQLRSERDEAAAQVDALRDKLADATRGQELMEDRVKLFTGDGGLGVDMQDLEEALAAIRRRKEQPSSLPFLHGGGDGEGAAADGAHNTRRVEELQVALVSANRELERTERMLRAQTAINRDLNAEITDTQRTRDGDSSSLRRRAADFEALAERRQQRLQAVEAQYRALLRRVHAMKRATRGREGEEDAGGGEDRDALGASLSLLGEGVAPGQNVLEVWVREARLDPTRVDRRASTFAMVDFMDFETQATPILAGLAPQFNFSTTYEVETDAFFVRHLATDSVTVELYRADGAEHRLLAQCPVPLRRLLSADAGGRVRLDDAPALSPHDGGPVGTVALELRLALPVDELLEAYLQQYPGERETLRRAQREGGVPGAGRQPLTGSHNHLLISVPYATGLLSRHGGDPSPSLYFRLPGQPYALSAVVPASPSPQFDWHQAFPMPVDEDSLNTLRAHTLEVLVLDDVDREASSRGVDGLLGVARVPLAPLADGQPVSASYDVTDERGRTVGALRFRAQWRDPLSVADVAGPRALSSRQVEALADAFGDGAGAVRYGPFLRFINPRQSARSVQGVLRRRVLEWVAEEVQGTRDSAAAAGAGAVEATEQVLAQLEDGLAAAAGGKRDGTLSPTALRRALRDVARWRLTHEEAEAVVAGARGAATTQVSAPREGGDGEQQRQQDELRACSPADVVAFARPPPPGIRALEDKLVAVFAAAAQRGFSPESEFAMRDPSSAGIVSRTQFRSALAACGLEVEESSAAAKAGAGGARDPRAEADWDQRGPAGKGKDTAEAVAEAAVDRDLAAADAPAPATAPPPRPPPPPYEAGEGELRARKEATGPSGAAAEAGSEAAFRERSPVAPPAQRTRDDGAATRIQASWRGSRARRNQPGRGAQRRPAKAQAEEEKAVDEVEAEGPGLADAEDLIADALWEEGENTQRGETADWEGVFAAMDVNGDGTLSRPELVTGLDKMGVRLPDSLVDTVCRSFDADGSGRIGFREFVRWMEPLQRPSSTGGKTRTTNLATLTDRLRDLIDKHSLPALFRELDADQDGEVTLPEAERALEKRGLEVEADDLRILFDLLDTRGIGAVDIADLRALEEDPLARVRSRLARHMRQARERSDLDLRGAFAHFDRDGSGRISKNEFRRTARDLRLDLSPAELELLFARFTSEKDNEIAFEDFAQFVEGAAQRADASRRAPTLEGMLPRVRAALSVARREGVRIAPEFEHYDPGRRGTLAARDFRRALRRVGVLTNGDEAAALQNSFAAEDRRVDYRRFLRWALPQRPDLGALASTIARAAASTYPSSTGRGGVDWSALWAGLDLDNSGSLSRRELAVGLRKLGVSQRPDETRGLMEALDSDGSGSIQRSEFVALADALEAGSGDSAREDAPSRGPTRPPAPRAPRPRPGAERRGRDPRRGGEHGGVGDGDDSAPAPRRDTDLRLGAASKAPPLGAEASRLMEELVGRAKQALASGQVGVVNKLFDAMDVDRSGSLAASELEAGLRAMGLSATLRDAEDLLQAFPLAAGRVAKDAFVSVMEERVTRAQEEPGNGAETARSDSSNATAQQGPRAAPFSRRGDGKATLAGDEQAFMVTVNSVRLTKAGQAALDKRDVTVRLRVLETASHYAPSIPVRGSAPAEINYQRVFPVEAGSDARGILSDALGSEEDSRSRISLRLFAVGQGGEREELGQGSLSLHDALNAGDDLLMQEVKVRGADDNEVASLFVSLQGAHVLIEAMP